MKMTFEQHYDFGARIQRAISDVTELSELVQDVKSPAGRIAVTALTRLEGLRKALENQMASDCFVDISPYVYYHSGLSQEERLARHTAYVNKTKAAINA